MFLLYLTLKDTSFVSKLIYEHDDTGWIELEM